jgi:hypothetical protein
VERYGYPTICCRGCTSRACGVVDVPVRPIYGEDWKSGINLGTALHPLPWVVVALVGHAAGRAGAQARTELMRIGVVTTSYPRRIGDHAGSFVAAHVQALRDLDHHVEVIGAHTITSSLFTGAGAPDELERGRGYVRGAWFTARLGAEIARRARDWDLIISHWLVPALAALPARKPLLAIAHGGDVHTLRRVTCSRRARCCATEARVRQRRAARARGRPERSSSRWASTRTLRTRSARAPSRTPRGSPRRAARLRSRLESCSRRCRMTKRAQRVIIAGDGPSAPCARAARERHVTGAVEAAATDDLLRDGRRSFVVPSRVLPNGRSEGMPMIALEALAAGVPGIASAVGGLASLEAATRVRPDDPLALAARSTIACWRHRRVRRAPRLCRAPSVGARSPHVCSIYAGCEAGDTSQPPQCVNYFAAGVRHCRSVHGQPAAITWRSSEVRATNLPFMAARLLLFPLAMPEVLGSTFPSSCRLVTTRNSSASP